METRPAMLGYLRQELVEGRIEDVEREIVSFADGEGFDVAEIFREQGPHTGALWSLISRVAQQRSAHVIVPTRMHLDGHSEPRRAFLERLSSMNAQVWYLSPADNAACSAHRPYRKFPDTPVGSVVGEFTFAVGTAELVALLPVREQLTRAGLREMVQATESVVLTIAREALHATRVPIKADTPIYTQLSVEKNQLTVRMSLRGSVLGVEILETRAHAEDAVSTAIVGLGVTGRAPAEGGGTFTWCELPVVQAPHPPYGAITYEASASTHGGRTS